MQLPEPVQTVDQHPRYDLLHLILLSLCNFAHKL